MGLDRYSKDPVQPVETTPVDMTAPAAEATPIEQDAALAGLDELVEETPETPAIPETEAVQ